MYDVGHTFIYALDNQEYAVKKVFKDLDLYVCDNTKPRKDEHGMPIMLTVFVSTEYISNHSCLD
jgi:hypothetical protein